MKISTFPAVKPFIKLTRGRIGVEEARWGKSDVWRGSRESRREAGAEGGRGEEGREGKGAKEGKVTLGTEVRERKQSLLLRWRRRGVISEENVRWTRGEER